MLNFQVTRQKKSLPFGKPFTISLHKYHRLTVWGKYDGDVYVLFASLRAKIKGINENQNKKLKRKVGLNRLKFKRKKAILASTNSNQNMFLLGKLFLLLLKPLTWIIVIFLIAMISKNLEEKKILVTAVLLLLFSNPFFFRILAKAYEKKPVILHSNEKYAEAIVLGGFVSYNVKTDEAYFNPASDRFIETALLYKRGNIGRIVIAAGNGYVVKNNFQEASFITDWLVELGIPQEDIFTDGLSRNTYENAVNSKRSAIPCILTGHSSDFISHALAKGGKLIHKTETGYSLLPL
jgi:uncharacterized SAM-binding protein YcdF (DUF218 family)